MEVLKYPDPRLLTPCKEVTVFGSELKVLLDSMWETMEREKGIGLAANQVGLAYRMFTMKGANDQKFYIVNPKIVEYGKNPSSMKEGCLSAPGQLIQLFRPSWIRLSYKDETGKGYTSIFMDTQAVCAQHEIEHLDGKSFLQNKVLPKNVRMALAEKWGLPVR